MHIAVVVFPGSNCDEDAVHVVRQTLDRLLGPGRGEVQRVWHKDPTLAAETSAVILPGGFSYGDALRSGAIARFSNITGAIKAFADRGGPVLGICNGFQILLEAGLLPGAMLQNASRKFVCRPIGLDVATTKTAFTSAYESRQQLRIPVAHHEGCYFAPPSLVERLQAEDRIVFRYSPGDNPNGSTANIAGILNAERNVMGMMPHPERACDPVLGSIDGQGVFTSMLGRLMVRSGTHAGTGPGAAHWTTTGDQA